MSLGELTATKYSVDEQSILREDQTDALQLKFGGDVYHSQRNNGFAWYQLEQQIRRQLQRKYAHK